MRDPRLGLRRQGVGTFTNVQLIAENLHLSHRGEAVIRAELNLVGLAMRAERKVIDKIVDGLKFHS
jgi:hypothetical protein